MWLISRVCCLKVNNRFICIFLCNIGTGFRRYVKITDRRHAFVWRKPSDGNIPNDLLGQVSLKDIIIVQLICEINLSISVIKFHVHKNVMLTNGSFSDILLFWIWIYIDFIVIYFSKLCYTTSYVLIKSFKKINIFLVYQYFTIYMYII